MLVEELCRWLDPLLPGVVVYAHRRWSDPEPGSAVVVVTIPTETAGRGSAYFPLIRALIFAAPSLDQIDAEAVGQPVINLLRESLHWLDPEPKMLGPIRVLGSTYSGSTQHMPVEGHDDWRVSSLTFELHLG